LYIQKHKLLHETMDASHERQTVGVHHAGGLEQAKAEQAAQVTSLANWPR
jgi:hypothetical protein